MTVRAIWTPSDVFEVTGSGYQPEGAILDASGASAELARDEALRWTLLVGAAMQQRAAFRHGRDMGGHRGPHGGSRAGRGGQGGYRCEVGAATLPARRGGAVQLRTQVHGDSARRRRGPVVVVCAKGAVERILDLCEWQMGRDGSQAQLDRTRVHTAAEALAARPARAGHGDGAGRCGRALRSGDVGRDAHADRPAHDGRSSPRRGDRRRPVVSQRGHRREDDHRRPCGDGRGNRGGDRDPHRRQRWPRAHRR